MSTNNFCSNCGGGWGCCGCSQPSCSYTVNVGDFSNTTPLLNAVNANTAGIGVLDAVDAQTAYFRGLDSANASFATFSLNATTHAIVLTIDVTALAAALPQATTTQKGVGETATDAEALAKASTTVFITPSNFAAMGSSTTFAGLVELATDAEAIAGVSTTLAITPANLAATIATFGTTVVFADAVARAAAVPAFKGQFGYQQDALSAWVSESTTAGDWQQIFSNGTTYNVDQANTFNVNTASQLQFTQFDAISTVGYDFNACGVQFTNSSVTYSNTLMNYASATPQVGGVSMGASQVWTTDGGGQVSSKALNTFISTSNTQAGYTAVSNPATIRTYDTATVTLQQLAQAVGTLIADLKAVKLPAT